VIIGTGVTKSYTGENLFENVNFKIGNSRKVAVVGSNGCGKTTLFKLIAGMEESTEGSIDKIGEVIGYIPQEFNFPDQLVGEYLEKHLEHAWEDYKIETLVSQLKYKNYDAYQEIKTLSEGQKMKLKMIEVLLNDPTILLVDEPTNHLDIDAIIWFEQYIRRLDKTVLMISHDREFLNNIVDEIWEIDKNKVLTFVGDYDNYKMEKLKLVNRWNQEYVLFLKRKKQLDKLLENVRKIKDGKSRGRAVGAVKKRIDREITQNEKEKYENERLSSVKFATDVTSQKLMVRFAEVTKSYGDNTVFDKLDFEIRAGEKVWLFGPNGAGKSTLVKMIMQEEKPTDGAIRIGNALKIGYFAQKQTHLDYDKTLFDYFIEETGCFFGKAYGLLEKFLFDKDMIQKKIRFLSPGQRARFAFAIFSYNDYDMLILDEPTNHLDIETKEAIEESLSNYKGTLLLVSHDRFFVERVGMTQRLNLSAGRLELV
jgi:ATP-binding cassette, subfamily F, member 3